MAIWLPAGDQPLPMKSVDDTVTVWIRDLKRGDEQAAEKIWTRYIDRLIRLARQKLGDIARRTADEEDVAISAFHSFVQAAQQGRFPALNDRSDLWKILVVITARKAVAQQRRHLAGTRPDAQLQGESAVSGPHDDQRILEAVLSAEPSPELAAQFAEDFSLRLAQLPGDDFRRIALWRLEGFTNREIADKLGTYEVKIERKLRIIRKYWLEADGELA